MTFNWQDEIKRLQNIPQLITTMDDNIAKHPDFYRTRMQLLDDFFNNHTSPVDIAIILYGGLFTAHHLAYHLQKNNLLFYRPKASHARVNPTPFLKGTIHPERTLLLFDEDMLTGNAMTETANYFTHQGYDRRNIFGYVDGGCKWRQPLSPELMSIDNLLQKERGC